MDVVVGCGRFVPRFFTEVLLQVFRLKAVTVACEDAVAHDAEGGLLVATEELACEEGVGGVVETSHTGVVLLQCIFHRSSFPFVEIIAFLVDFIEMDAFQCGHDFPATVQDSAAAIDGDVVGHTAVEGHHLVRGNHTTHGDALVVPF